MDVVPDGVEAAGYRDQRVPECVTHPDSEHGVFLTHGLAGLDAAAVSASGAASYGELEDAAEHGDKGNAYQSDNAASAMYDGSGTHEYGKCKSKTPQVKAQVYFGGNPIVESRHEPAYRPGG